jgi:hypothetical protein
MASQLSKNPSPAGVPPPAELLTAKEYAKAAKVYSERCWVSMWGHSSARTDLITSTSSLCRWRQCPLDQNRAGHDRSQSCLFNPGGIDA